MELITNMNSKPGFVEILFGYSCFACWILMFGYKLYTGRGVFMLNPCHFVVLFSGIILICKKNKITANFFIVLQRYLFGPWSALLFPVMNGLDLPYEVELFLIEHYLAILCPLILIVFGRFGYYNKGKDAFFE